MQRKYEIVYIFDSALEEPEVNERLDRFHELLKSPDQPDPLTGIAHWGKRTLAYPIKKKEVGYYVVAHFETDTDVLNEFERIIKLDESVLRYLIVINEGLPVARIDQPGSENTTSEESATSDKPVTAASDATTDEVAPTPATEAPAPAPAAEETPETDSEEESTVPTDEGGE